tara:strand:- start:33604 stop:34050 length:447 start_codon:yes stop_codon:yes gene_type:complete
MKFINTLLLAVAISVSVNCFANSSRLSVKVNNIVGNQGVVRVAIFNNEKAFTDDDTSGKLAFKSCVKPPKADSISCQFNLPYGTYAISLFHDKDKSDKLSTGWFGVPEEGYGFSNNPVKSGHASWNQAKFVVATPKQSMLIHMLKDNA